MQTSFRFCDIIGVQLHAFKFYHAVDGNPYNGVNCIMILYFM